MGEKEKYCRRWKKKRGERNEIGGKRKMLQKLEEEKRREAEMKALGLHSGSSSSLNATPVATPVTSPTKVDKKEKKKNK